MFQDGLKISRPSSGEEDENAVYAEDRPHYLSLNMRNIADTYFVSAIEHPTSYDKGGVETLKELLR